jgi:hypothetical protein
MMKADSSIIQRIGTCQEKITSVLDRRLLEQARIPETLSPAAPGGGENGRLGDYHYGSGERGGRDSDDVPLATATKVRDLKSQIKALSDSLEDAAADNKKKENVIQSLRREQEESVRREHENDRQHDVASSAKDDQIASLNNEVYELRQQSARATRGDSDSFTEEAVREVIALKAENQGLSTEINRLTANTQSILACLKESRHILDGKLTELRSSRARAAQLQALVDTQAGAASESRIQELEMRNIDLLRKLQGSAAAHEALLSLEGRGMVCNEALVGLVTEAKTVAGLGLPPSKQPVVILPVHPDVAVVDSSVHRASSASLQQQQSEGEEGKEEGRGTKRPRPSLSSSSSLSSRASVPPSSSLQRNAAAAAGGNYNPPGGNNNPQTAAAAAVKRVACCYCSEAAYGLMAECEKCGQTFHAGCGGKGGGCISCMA